MEFILVILVVAALVWALVFAKCGSICAGCTLFVSLGYVLTRDFWQAHLGPIPLTADRVLMAGLVALFGWRWWRGTLKFRAANGADLLAGLLLGYLTLRWSFTPAAEGLASSVSPSWRLIASFWMSAVLYIMIRNAELDSQHWKWLLLGLVSLGTYLAFTGVAEVTHQWWAVFPRFIANPELGTHFGRARGPALMSASLGVYLTICFWAAWFLWQSAGRWSRLALIGVMALMVLGLYFTYTRSCWLGLLGGMAIVPVLHFPREWRSIVVTGLLLGGGLGGLFLGGKVVDLGRKDSDASAGHSVSQRASFAIVSMRMFRDAPLVGCGFGRFYDMKMPYLSERSQQIELESLRKLDHHNTFLSILTETGLIGFALFVGLFFAWGRCSWRLYRSFTLPMWIRCHGLFSLATLIAYAVNALFHDLTLSPCEQWILCLVMGVSSGLVSLNPAVAARQGAAINTKPQTQPSLGLAT